MNPLELVRNLLSNIGIGKPPVSAAPTDPWVDKGYTKAGRGYYRSDEKGTTFINKSSIDPKIVAQVEGGQAGNVPSPTPSVAEVEKQIKQNFEGFRRQTPPPEIGNLIQSSAGQHGIDPTLLAALLYQESRFDPAVTGGSDPNDRGIAQINRKAHPEVSDEQAYDPNFAIPFAAKKLKSDIDYFGNVNQGISAYNVGRGGAKLNGPWGTAYRDNVARNIEKSYLDQLGVQVSKDFYYD